MRPADFFLALEFDRKREKERMKATAELMRGAVVRIMNLFIKKPVREVRDVWAFPWDEIRLSGAEHELLSLEQIKEKIYGESRSEFEG